MSFGGGGGFGFGAGSNTNTNNTFGAFGAGNTNNAATGTGFGSANTGNAFGSPANTGGSLFGGNNNPTGGTGFGAFGATNNTNTAFGAKPFGGTTGGLFGNTGTAGTGGFGSGGGFGSNSNTTTTPAFGSTNTAGGGIFGAANKPAFGAGTTGTTGLFGGGSTAGGFGATNTTSGFGASTSGGFGAAAQPAVANTGTSSTPFTAVVEKDGTTQTSQYQTITFQDPYKNFSLEELRMVDYAQGRRFGNQNGQAGAFGQSTNFGAFPASTSTPSAFGASNTNTGGNLSGATLFGSGNTNTTTPAFGQNNTTNAFGSTSNTGGGLFGQNKPAGGLFGSTPANQPASGGGLFGGGSTSNTAFGSGGAFGSTNTGGGLFGNQNQTQTQNKPFGTSFGASTTTPTPAFGGAGNTAFGQSNTTTGGGGLFGQNNQASAAPAFGATPQTTNTGGGLFGGGGAFGQTQQNQTTTPSGGGLFGGGGAFGQNQQNQQKPGGLFGGSTNTGTTGGTSLFGQQNNQPQQSGGLFGNTNNQTTGGSLFGNKPATTGTGLFGNSTTATNTTGGGLFSNLGQNTQQNQGSSLFGQQNQQTKPGGLFGGSTTTNTNTGGGLFGGLGQSTNNQSTLGGGGSLFGSQNQQQQNQQSQSGTGLFGGSAGPSIQTSITQNPYGNDQLLFPGGVSTVSKGPLATPLGTTGSSRKSAILPQHKLNPSASTRLLTPQKRTGYGFSYSTYGTPNSVSSNPSPGMGSSLLGGASLNRSLSRSMSNLRNGYTPETSILAPGAFSTTGRSFAGGSLKKLNVNRSINTRTPLFPQEQDTPTQHGILKKTVSFDKSVTGSGESAVNGSSSNALVPTRNNDQSYDTSSSLSGGTSSASSRPEMEQVNGGNLTSVPENGAALRTASASSLNAKEQGVEKNVDGPPGNYWMRPSLDELKQMSGEDLKHVRNFVVGRKNIGQVQFGIDRPVDLSTTPLDKLIENIIVLTPRNASVFGDKCDVTKPQMGKGLNIPSRITLENSWPRSSKRGSRASVPDVSGLKSQKHIERLKRVTDTHFVEYRHETGAWTFDVDHFSSYGLDDEDDEDDEDEEMGTSELSAPPDTPTQFNSSQGGNSTPQESSFLSPSGSSLDDTFDFKKGKVSRANVPGGFEGDVTYDEEMDVSTDDSAAEESFLGERSAGSLDQYSDHSESESVEDQDMAGPVSAPIQTAEQSLANPFVESLKPKSILKASQHPRLGTPSKGPLVFDDDWANQLQRTISPKKQDREALRQSQGEVLRERDGNAPKLAESLRGQTIATSIDLMNSLFGETKQGNDLLRKVHKGIELPYAKRPKSSHDLDNLTESDKGFHLCNKPHFSEDGTLIYANTGHMSLEGGVFLTTQKPIVTAHKDVRFTKLPTFPDASPPTLDVQKAFTRLLAQSEVPTATVSPEFDFADFSKAVVIDGPAGAHEQKVWELLAVLFDEYDDIPEGMNEEEFSQHKERYRKDKLSEFWESLVRSDAEKHAQQAKTAEEKAIAHLSCHDVPEACHTLLNGLDLRLATLVALIGGDMQMREDMALQIEEWRRMDVLAEMEDPVRAIYELLAGNCGKCEGKTDGGKENKTSTFTIAKRFGLDWRRAFALRLWYGTLDDEPIEMAVAQFADALRDGFEEVKPVPWFVEQGVDMGFNDPEANNREDILWGILKLYASSKLDLPANVEDILAPQNVSGNPLNARLSFQLFHLFNARRDEPEPARQIGLPTNRSGDGANESFLSSTASSTVKYEQAEDSLTALGDSLTLTYASSLHTEKYWTTAAFVYAHVSSVELREQYIRSLLSYFSNTYEMKDGDPHFDYLTKKLGVPRAWLYSAGALRAKVEGNDLQQTLHLLEAGELVEAHQVLCRSVGPSSVISRDYDALREVLGGFIPTPENSPVEETHRGRGRPRAKKEPVPGWNHGGQIYFDYIHLVDLTSHRPSFSNDEDLTEEISSLLKKLQSSLETIAHERWESRGLEERVALAEISGFVAELVRQNKGADKGRILKLPLTEDRWLHHTREISLSYYHTLMGVVN